MEWGRKVFLGDLVGSCQLHAPGLPQASWLAATPTHKGAGSFFEGGGILGKVREHSLAAYIGEVEAAMQVIVDCPMEIAHPDS